MTQSTEQTGTAQDSTPQHAAASPAEVAADQIETDARAGRSAADLDAGVDPAAPPAVDAGATTPAAGVADVEDVLEALRDVVDPELGINIVDLGLIYDVIVDDANVATLDMTLTSAACPLTDMIEDQVRASLTGEGLVEDFRINWVWMPPWDLTRITDDGRDQLRALGFSI
ncbi:metal-sulfur cluster assembly factor [Nakamurella sp. A5-74]|uniref:Metal-sulfur cluster assembly factor n=1 Tax=Nakamurella sp. A5-74 TaxID=3158264 RepID=A0AAU8DJM5_9ACTN